MLVPVLLLALATAPLRSGDTFPPFPGETISGRKVTLPEARKLQAVIFSFSRAGGNDGRRWNDQIAKEVEAHRLDECYLMIMLGGAPRLLRGMIASGIKGGMPPDVRDHSIISYKDEAVWKQRLAVSDDNRAYVVLVEGSGRVVWTNSGPFSEAEFAKLHSMGK